MSRPTLIAACLLAAAFAAPARASGPDAAARYDAARDQYEIGHYDSAFATFAALADGGHCDAARMAAQMARHGRSLYATEFKVAPERLAGWQRQTHCARPQRQVAGTR
jgi:hypothetical protein